MARQDRVNEIAEMYGWLTEEQQKVVCVLIDRIARIHQGMATKDEIRSIQLLREKHARGELTAEDVYQSASAIPKQ